MTDNTGYIAMALPNGCRVEEAPDGRPAVVFNGNSAEFFHRLLGDAIRQLTENQWKKQQPDIEPRDLGDGIQEWRPVHSDPRVVVWTKPGGRVMVQNLEPGNLDPFDAFYLGEILREAAHYASYQEES